MIAALIIGFCWYGVLDTCALPAVTCCDYKPWSPRQCCISEPKHGLDGNHLQLHGCSMTFLFTYNNNSSQSKAYGIWLLIQAASILSCETLALKSMHLQESGWQTEPEAKLSRLFVSLKYHQAWSPLRLKGWDVPRHFRCQGCKYIIAYSVVYWCFQNPSTGDIFHKGRNSQT